MPPSPDQTSLRYGVIGQSADKQRTGRHHHGQSELTKLSAKEDVQKQPKCSQHRSATNRTARNRSRRTRIGRRQHLPVVAPMGDDSESTVATRTTAATPMVHCAQVRHARCPIGGSAEEYRRPMLLRWHQVTLIDTSHEAGPTGEETLYKAEPETAWRHNDKDNRATSSAAPVVGNETS